MAINPDFSDLFAVFSAHEVRYLVVGAYAVTFHARPRFTKDLDVWVDPVPENAQRVWKALAEFGAPMDDVSPEDFATAGRVFQIGVAPNRIDVLTRIEAVEFTGAWQRRTPASYGDQPIQVLSREDLIRNKRAVGRQQDLIDVRELERGED